MTPLFAYRIPIRRLSTDDGPVRELPVRHKENLTSSTSSFDDAA